MNLFALIPVAAIGLVAIAIAVNANRTVARGLNDKARDEDLGYLAASTAGYLSDTDQVENAYLEDHLGGYNPDGTPSDPNALRKLAEEEQSR